ncbi:MAG TPA: TetR/AcrR family transcriptional regulator [Firmicutes bacterium]|nr:TetR/AcrR family transcriptional regulator [Bacillota bacterium]
MTRISKEPEERRAEIIEAATKLFIVKGFEQTAVSDIVHSVNVAQGTFYYYFKSKDDVMLAIIDQLHDETIQQLSIIVKRTDLSITQKLAALSEAEFQLNREHDDLYSQLHSEENSGVHQKIIVKAIRKMVPLYAEVIEEGVRQGIFNTKYPKEAAEFMLVSTKFLFDPGIFHLSSDEILQRGQAAQDISERVLGAPKGSLAVNMNDRLVGIKKYY